MLTLLRNQKKQFSVTVHLWKSDSKMTANHTAWDSKKSANSSFTEGERWTAKDGRNGHHRADTRAYRLVRRLYCDSTKERRWGADLHWLQKAEHDSVIKCERYVLLTVEDILHKLKGSTIFTKLDVTSGFWQIPLDDELQPNSLHSSVHLADTSTADCHRALHLRQRVPSAPWKRSLQERSMLYVSGSSMTFSCSVKTRRRSSRKVTLEEHHAAKLNSAWARQLCHWSTTGDGVKADPRKTEAILEMPDPTDVAELRRFLGMVNYLGRYLHWDSVFSSPATSHRTPRGRRGGCLG